ncbi:hypothetical protein [Ornithinicoccus halotolerans]|uniref:hypothetical protein n=1 Tax=Ornithinicoccus halotolerans TaxID=1748220 RepID=UPI001296A599|nr:hypothetical protein [Ornithinicoccus halotolerans]
MIPDAPSRREETAGRVAAAVAGVEATALAGFALYYLWQLIQGRGTDPVVVIMSVVTMVVFVVGLGYIAVGLWLRHPRAQAPAIAVNALLMPLGIAMFQFAPAWAAGLVLGAAVVGVVAGLAMGRMD